MLADLQEECPNTWESSKMDIPGGEIWLNATIALANCTGAENLEASAQVGDPSGDRSHTTPATGSASVATKINAISAGLAVGAILVM